MSDSRLYGYARASLQLIAKGEHVGTAQESAQFALDRLAELEAERDHVGGTASGTTRAEIEANGMWLGSGLGVSFVCRCGWNSGIMPEPADVRRALDHHIDVSHVDGLRGLPCKHKDHWNCDGREGS